MGERDQYPAAILHFHFQHTRAQEGTKQYMYNNCSSSQGVEAATPAHQSDSQEVPHRTSGVAVALD